MPSFLSSVKTVTRQFFLESECSMLCEEAFVILPYGSSRMLRNKQ